MKNIKSAFLGLILIVSLFSCKDSKWDMYENKPAYLEQGSLFNLLSHKPEFSEFLGLLKKTGYDSVLKRTDLFTVLAVKNGAFASIDTSTNTPALKLLMGMHILKSAIQPQDMLDNHYLALTNKYVNFLSSGTVITANDVTISSTSSKALNGLIYGLERAILPVKTLREIVASNPDFSMFNAYIDQSFVRTIDVAKNIITGYDNKNQPVYQPPIVYKTASTYMDTLKLDDEKILSTLFIPTDQVVKKVLTGLLTARANQNSLIVPRTLNPRRDTTIGYFFIPRNVTYPGDTAILLNYLFKNVITRTFVHTLNIGGNTFSNVTGGQFSINSSQSQLNGSAASNGVYYILNDITLPEKVYRKIFVFDPSIQHPTDPNQIVVNPNLVYSMGASNVTTAIPVGAAISGFPRHERARQFNFTNVGGQIDFTLPLLTKGKYKVVLQQVPINTGTYLNASFGNVQLKKMINASIQFTLPGDPVNQPFIDVNLGEIIQGADGSATITLKCAQLGPLTSSSWAFILCNIRFEPI